MGSCGLHVASGTLSCSAWVSSRPAAAAAAPATAVFAVPLAATAIGSPRVEAGMASSRRSEETDPLVGVVGPAAAPGAKGPRAAALSPEVEARLRAMRAAEAEETKKMFLPRPRQPTGQFPRLARLWRRYFVRFDPDSIPAGHPLSDEELDLLQRHLRPGHFELLALDRQLVTKCLDYYNSMHPGDEYEPAPGKVSQHPHFYNGNCWTHGNFLARKKRSGCFSFLPAPRTLFFFELAYRQGFDGVVTCTAFDEPVTEAYSVLGFPLWWSARRTGIFDCFCKTCHRRFDVPHPGIQKIFACGHKHVENVCEMCYRRSHVLHPPHGEFAFGYHDPYRPYGPTLLSTDTIDHCGWETTGFLAYYSFGTEDRRVGIFGLLVGMTVYKELNVSLKLEISQVSCIYPSAGDVWKNVNLFHYCSFFSLFYESRRLCRCDFWSSTI